MYTVIITDNKTSRDIIAFKPLFMPYVHKGDIDFCEWNEGGDHILAALPNPYKLVGKKDKWRAVIIANPASSNSKNPFDHCLSAQNDEPNPAGAFIPLVRLTQMIGGVPKNPALPSAATGEEANAAETKTGKAVQPVNPNEADTRFEFLAARPIEMVLISLRQKNEEEQPQHQIEQSWNHRFEAENSMFWARNQYPDLCRFVLFDIENPAHAFYHKNLFAFWCSVLTITVNDIPPSELQAYKLYRASVELDTEAFKTEASQYYNKLNFYKSTLLQESEKLIVPADPDKTDDPPDIKARVPLIFNRYDPESMSVDSQRFGLSKDCPVQDDVEWQKQISTVQQSCRKFCKAPMRALDTAAGYARTVAIVDPRKVTDLNQYQMQDLLESMEMAENRMLTTETSNTLDGQAFQSEIREADREIQKLLRTRMTKRITILAGVLAVVLYFLSFLPFFIHTITEEGSGLRAILLILLFSLAMAVGGFITLIVMRYALGKKIRSFNNNISALKEKVFDSAQRFATWLSEAATYMKGASYLAVLSNEKHDLTSQRYILYRHTHTLDKYIHNCRWCMSLYNLSPELTADFTGSTDFDVTQAPDTNMAYAPETPSCACEIPLNKSGEKLVAPYRFIKALTMKREEVYEWNNPAG